MDSTCGNLRQELLDYTFQISITETLVKKKLTAKNDRYQVQVALIQLVFNFDVM